MLNHDNFLKLSEFKNDWKMWDKNIQSTTTTFVRFKDKNYLSLRFYETIFLNI